jgi:hypothetical protein
MQISGEIYKQISGEIYKQISGENRTWLYFFLIYKKWK